MDRGAWQAIVHGVTKSWTQLSMHMHMHTHTHTHTHTHIHTLTPTKNDVIVSLKGLKTTLSNFHISSKTL